MRLFNRAKEEDGDDNADQQVHAVDAASVTPPATAVPSPVGAPAGSADADELDATVKEMSEKIAKLSSSLETVSNERASFEEKVERMEDRMRKLSSLTEMMSAQYNPFVGEEPAERARIKANGAAAALVKLKSGGFELPREGPIKMPLEDAAPAAAPAADVEESAEAEPEPEVATPEPSAEDAAPEPAAPAPVAPATSRLDAVAPGFVGNMLLLNWSSMLLKATRSREGLQQLAEYYHDLGWIGESVRDALVAYSQGIACEDDEPARDWRADAELHERSLLFIEKLKGGTA